MSTTVHVSATGEVLGQTQLTETFSIGQQRDFLTGEKKMVSNLVSSEFAQGEDVELSESTENLIERIEKNGKQDISNGFQHLNYEGSGQATIDKTGQTYTDIDGGLVVAGGVISSVCVPCGKVVGGLGFGATGVSWITNQINKEQGTVQYYNKGQRKQYSQGKAFSIINFP